MIGRLLVRRYVETALVAVLLGLGGAAGAQESGPLDVEPEVEIEERRGGVADYDVEPELERALEGIDDAIGRVREGGAVALDELASLRDDLRNELDDLDATARLQDYYYDLLRAMDSAVESLREQSRASTVSALEQANAILEDMRAALEGEPEAADAEDVPLGADNP